MSGLHDGFNGSLVLAVPDRTAARTADIRGFDLAAPVWLNGRVRPVGAFAWNAPPPG